MDSFPLVAQQLTPQQLQDLTQEAAQEVTQSLTDILSKKLAEKLFQGRQVPARQSIQQPVQPSRFQIVHDQLNHAWCLANKPVRPKSEPGDTFWRDINLQAHHTLLDTGGQPCLSCTATIRPNAVERLSAYGAVSIEPVPLLPRTSTTSGDTHILRCLIPAHHLIERR